jgi:hypothetical protein
VKKAPTLAASSFAIVADLRPASPTIVLMTPVYIPAATPDDEDVSHDHRVAVFFDEDEDERVIDVLTAILYRAPRTFSKIAAVSEHKGLLTVWTQQGTTEEDRALMDAATDTTVLRGDYWPVEYRELGRAPDGKLFIMVHSAGTEQLSVRDHEVLFIDGLIPLGSLPDPKIEPAIAAAIEAIKALSPATNKSTLSLKKRGRGRRE